MKTPMQELINKINNEELDHLDDCKMFIQEYMLDYEREYIGYRIKKDKEGAFGETDIW